MNPFSFICKVRRRLYSDSTNRRRTSWFRRCIRIYKQLVSWGSAQGMKFHWFCSSTKRPANLPSYPLIYRSHSPTSPLTPHPLPYLPTHPLPYLPTHPPTYLPTHPPPYLPTHPPPYLPTNPLPYLPTHFPTYPPTHLPTYQPSHPPTKCTTYPPNYLPSHPPWPPTYSPTHLPTLLQPTTLPTNVQ